MHINLSRQANNYLGGVNACVLKFPPPCRAEVKERTIFLFVHSVTLSSAITASQPSTTVAAILVGCRAQHLALHCLSMALLKTRVYPQL